MPPGLETRLISTVTGKPARPGDPNAKFEIFMANNLPDEDRSDATDAPPSESPTEKDKPDDSLF
jgi:hypothetical protein